MAVGASGFAGVWQMLPDGGSRGCSNGYLWIVALGSGSDITVGCSDLVMKSMAILSRQSLGWVAPSALDQSVSDRRGKGEWWSSTLVLICDGFGGWHVMIVQMGFGWWIDGGRLCYWGRRLWVVLESRREFWQRWRLTDALGWGWSSRGGLTGLTQISLDVGDISDDCIDLRMCASRDTVAALWDMVLGLSISISPYSTELGFGSHGGFVVVSFGWRYSREQCVTISMLFGYQRKGGFPLHVVLRFMDTVWKRVDWNMCRGVDTTTGYSNAL
ncbi:hypothetical protein RchiOBHm_Chr1g0320101 [Rosa chinensis]|uniref:Uncharacterized protein n=1 Tax=Rosa chinensis TaxID=74649 RepID=A0A2P6S8K5_ROSCH|nr:hypothetical protein RchiOBHm_Chr1g0320101 [Rosa chinensis]